MTEREQWEYANQRYLMAHLDIIHEALEKHRDAPTIRAERVTLPPIEHALSSALDTLCKLFGLTLFERDILLMCAGIELDSTFAPLCAAAQGEANWNYPTFSLALAALPDAYWSALAPDKPLRHWQLIKLDLDRTVAYSPLRIDERILHYLVGVSYLDQQLGGWVQPLVASGELVASHQALARELAAAWSKSLQGYALPIIQLLGGETASKREIAIAASWLLEHNVCEMNASAIPTELIEFERFMRLWAREASLGNRVLYLDCSQLERQDVAHENAVRELVESLSLPLILASHERRAFTGRSVLTYDVNKPEPDEQLAIWQDMLGEQASPLNGHLARLTNQFNLNASGIRAVIAGARGSLEASNHRTGDETETLGNALWDACRVQSRPQLENLAQRIEPAASWDDLILPEAQKNILREVVMHVRQRARVYEDWDFSSKGARGLGICALFSGVSGVGKTMAAEVLANELRLDLYRIDLSQVVNKYIGETEKNLSRVFDAAEESGAILLFDEADALFGKRTEVRDSHDRFANIEISYLLQRMEAYRGLAILTTNMKDALDQAFLRRIRFLVQFPFPDTAQRAEIWERIFPAALEREGLDSKKLAQLNISGGNIRNIALGAAFFAADAGEPLRMKHVLRAARREYGKMEKTLTSAEVKGWDETTTD